MTIAVAFNCGYACMIERVTLAIGAGPPSRGLASEAVASSIALFASVSGVRPRDQSNTL